MSLLLERKLAAAICRDALASNQGYVANRFPSVSAVPVNCYSGSLIFKLRGGKLLLQYLKW